MKIVITRRMRYRAITLGIWIVGYGAVRLAVTGHASNGVVLLLLALGMNGLRDWAFPYEVRGFPPA